MGAKDDHAARAARISRATVSQVLIGHGARFSEHTHGCPQRSRTSTQGTTLGLGLSTPSPTSLERLVTALRPRAALTFLHLSPASRAPVSRR